MSDKDNENLGEAAKAEAPTEKAEPTASQSAPAGPGIGARAQARLGTFGIAALAALAGAAIAVGLLSVCDDDDDYEHSGMPGLSFERFGPEGDFHDDFGPGRGFGPGGHRFGPSAPGIPGRGLEFGDELFECLEDVRGQAGTNSGKKTDLDRIKAAQACFKEFGGR